MNTHSGLIRRKTLHEEVVGIVREMIVSGEFEPGQKLPEKMLCEVLNVSRTPLREALKALAGEGMLELLPQRGARVAVITQAEILEVFPVLASLEALAGEIACSRISDDQIAAIDQLHGGMVAAYRAGDRQEYARLNRAIHLAIFDAANNQTLLGLYLNLGTKIRNIRHTARKSAPNWQQAIEDHDEIMVALKARDGARMAIVMKQHIMNTARSVQLSISDMA